MEFMCILIRIIIINLLTTKYSYYSFECVANYTLKLGIKKNNEKLTNISPFNQIKVVNYHNRES
uniref:Uncharacterized protein n=1 Tax=Lepeophtheirus salmonis TaxID=72036 RepID=A0A0K2VFX3_LEPSM